MPSPTLLQHTLRHVNCPACLAALTLAKREKGMPNYSLFEALDLLLASKRAKARKPKTLECYTGYAARLREFFGDIPLRDIHAGSLKAYQIARQEGIGCFAGPDNAPHQAGASSINHELNALSQLLKRAEMWKDIRDFYAPLEEGDWHAPKTFTNREEENLFETSANDPNLELFDIVARITRNTTASGSELRGLRLRDLELNAKPPRVHIPPDATKNNIRPRTIPLNTEALEAFDRAVERAARLGVHMPYHYLFPFRVNRRLYDPLRPASRSWLRKQTVKMREATGIQHIRPHAFRHLAVTELLERGVPEQTVIAIAGWVSRKMIETYSHARIEAKAEALRVLDRKKPPKSAEILAINSLKNIS